MAATATKKKKSKQEERFIDVRPSHKPAVEIPQGWDLLEGGTERRLRVNSHFIKTGEGYPYYLIENAGEWDEKVTFYDEVKILGPSEGGIDFKRCPFTGKVTERGVFIRIVESDILVKP